MAENKKYHFRQILSTLLKEETNFSSAKQSSKLNSRRGIAKKPKNGLILSLTVFILVEQDLRLDDKNSYDRYDLTCIRKIL